MSGIWIGLKQKLYVDRTEGSVIGLRIFFYVCACIWRPQWGEGVHKKQTKGTKSADLWQWQGGQEIRKNCGRHIWKPPVPSMYLVDLFCRSSHAPHRSAYLFLKSIQIPCEQTGSILIRFMWQNDWKLTYNLRDQAWCSGSKIWKKLSLDPRLRSMYVKWRKRIEKYNKFPHLQCPDLWLIHSQGSLFLVLRDREECPTDHRD